MDIVEQRKPGFRLGGTHPTKKKARSRPCFFALPCLALLSGQSSLSGSCLPGPSLIIVVKQNKKSAARMLEEKKTDKTKCRKGMIWIRQMDREGKRGDKKERKNRPRRLSCHVHVAASSHRLYPLGSFFPLSIPPFLYNSLLVLLGFMFIMVLPLALRHMRSVTRKTSVACCEPPLLQPKQSKPVRPLHLLFGIVRPSSSLRITDSFGPL